MNRVSLLLLLINCVHIEAFIAPTQMGDWQKNNWLSYNEVENIIDEDANTILRNTISGNSTSSSPEEKISRDFPGFANFFQTFLPVAQANHGEKFNRTTESPFEEEATVVDSSTKNKTSAFLSRLLQNVIIDRNSIFRVQFYNADFSEGNSTSDNNDSSIMPNAMFGSPLCFGLCFNGQIYSENSSIRILSDKQYSLFGESSSSTGGAHQQPSQSNFTQTFVPGDDLLSREKETGAVGWIPPWIYNITPSISISSSLPLQQITLVPSLPI